jgi:hypothetical protein
MTNDKGTNDKGMTKFQMTNDADKNKQLSGDELAVLAQRLLDASDPAEKQRLRDELTRGFYGEQAG